MIYNLMSLDHIGLRRATVKFDFDNPQMDPVELAENLKETMIANRAYALSANQCGINLSVFVVGNPDDPNNIITVFNPTIVWESEETINEEEGCVTYNGLFIKVKRPSYIRARYAAADGSVDTHKLNEFMAKYFQQANDYLIGINFTSRASSVQVDRARKEKKRLDKLRKKYLINLVK